MIPFFLLLVSLRLSDMPADISELYSAGQYSEMAAIVDSIVADPSNMTISQLARFHMWKGFAMVGMGQRLRARTEFAIARELDPEIELDPLEVSPKIIDEFRQATASLSTDPDRDDTSYTSRYILLKDERPLAAVQSLLLPGWGQWNMGRRYRGVAFGTTAIAMTMGYFISGDRERDARHDYLRAPASEIEDRYDDYDLWYKTHRAFGYGVAATWMLGILDVLTGPSHDVRISASPTEARISIPLK